MNNYRYEFDSTRVCVRAHNYWHLRSGASLITAERLAEGDKVRV